MAITELDLGEIDPFYVSISAMATLVVVLN
jgi:hypothetical protein